MTRRGIGWLAAAALLAIAAPALGSPWSHDLRSAAVRLERAAKARGAVPDIRLAPAPLGGPPRYSPSIDDWLHAALSGARGQRTSKARAQSLRSIAASLRYLAGASEQLPSNAPPRGDVAATAAKILSEPAYRQAATTPGAPPEQSIFERAIRWFFDRLGRIFDGLAQATQGAPLVGTAFALALIAIAVLALAYVGFRIADGFVVRRRVASFGGGEPLPEDASAEHLQAAAHEAAGAGDFARAATLLFQASLVLLDRTGRIAYDPARTAGEYRRLVRQSAQTIAGEFDALARIFTAAAYADEPLGDLDWHRAAAAFAQLSRPLGAQ